MWTVDHIRGDAGEVHARRPSEDLGPTVWVIDITSPALVLGSTQSIDDIDVDACQRAGIDVVRRDSGGGAVLLLPREVLWIDVILPNDHPAWEHDVSRSAWWLGDVWADVLGGLGIERTSVHRGPLVTSAWSKQFCFAGVGAGEVMTDGRKLVGISQRRTRTHARFQCAIHHDWRPDVMQSLVHHGDATLEMQLARCTATSDVSDEALTTALLGRLEAL